MAEQANTAPEEECFLFDDRVHTNAAVDDRIDEVVRGLIAVGVRQGAHIGVLMDTSPSAVAAIAALSRLGAAAVLLPPDDDLAAAMQLCEVADIITDPHHLTSAAATGARVLILGHRQHHRPLPDGFGPGRRAGWPGPGRCADTEVVSTQPGPRK